MTSERRPTGPDLGPTLNERPLVSGLMPECDAAARRRDRDTMIAPLMRVTLSEDRATRSVDTILAIGVQSRQLTVTLGAWPTRDEYWLRPEIARVIG